MDINISSSQPEESMTSPIPKMRKKYEQHYRAEWEKEFPWIGPSKEGSNFFCCKTCNRDLQCDVTAARKHEKTAKHTNKSAVLQIDVQSSSFSSSSSSSSLSTLVSTVPDTMEQNNRTKELEIRVAAFIAEHSLPFRLMDHFDGIIKFIAKYPEAGANFSMKRTKCAAVIKNVIADYSRTLLIQNLQQNNFSILIDESTDHSGVKHLAIVTRFIINGNVHDQFLDLIQIADATARNIYNVIVDFFSKHNIDYKNNLIGFGADGAHTMMGERNSVQTLLKSDIPHLVVVKCICHSLALCASNACLRLPRTVEDLVREIYTYFQYSFKRQAEFKKFQDFVSVKPHKILQNSQTRWLSLLSVVRRVIEQYNALKLYFISEHVVDSVNASYMIHVKLSDNINLCYLEFLEFILPYITELNIEFQSESPKLYELYYRMASLCKTIMEFYIQPIHLKNIDFFTIDYKNPRLYVPLEQINLGQKIYAKFSGNEFEESVKKQFRIRCLDFYIELVTQIFKRFPFQSDFVKALRLMDFLSPENITKINSLGHLLNCSLFTHIITDVYALDREWKLLKNDYSIAPLFKLDTKNFWREISKMKKGDDTLKFPNLIKLISYIFILPHSSACVERIFSRINLNKTKFRNRLSTEALSSILHSTKLISCDNNNCNNFTINSEMLSRHKNNMYQ